MSQIYKAATSNPPPPGFVVSLTPDLGAAVVPNGSGTINLTGLPTGTAQSTADSNFETFNAGTSTMQIAHRYQGGATTTDGTTPVTILTIPVTVASTMNITAQLSGINSAPAGVGGEISGTVFRGGAGATLLGVPDKVVRSSVALSAATFDVNASGNNLIVTVTGVAATNIEWYIIAQIVNQSFI